MTAPRERRPALAALPLGLIALVAITAAARAPQPVAAARTPDCAALNTIITDNFSSDLHAYDATPSSQRFPDKYVVLVFDANNTYVRGVYGTGTVGLRVAGDTRSGSERGVVHNRSCSDPAAATDGPATGGRGGNPAAHQLALQMRAASDTATPCCAPWRVEPLARAGEDLTSWSRLFVDDHLSDSYVVGIEDGMRGLLGPGRPLTLAPNQAAGLTLPVPDSSGIAGIPASSIYSVDEVSVNMGQLGGVTAFVVSLTTASPHK